VPTPSVTPAPSLGATILLSAAVFAVTNADGILLLTFFFGHRPVHRWRVVAGQFAGFGAIVALALLGRWAATFVPLPRIGLLGLIPIGLGVHQCWTARARRRAPVTAARLSVLRVATVIFASGADNIAVYVPLFATSSALQLGAMLSTFAVLSGAACALAALLGGHHLLQEGIQRFGPRLSGILLIGLGVYILWSSGALPSAPAPF
jgi:cadmium resistance protein CadD (predicted permease)